MALHVRSETVDRLARKIAKRTGETLTEAISKALAERLDRLEAGDRKNEDRMIAELTEISDRAAKLLRRTGKTSTELLDELYDENGLPRS
jgi:antitoxin VapB